MIKILLVEKNLILSDCLKEEFEQDQRLSLVSICRQGSDVMKLIETQPVDMIVIDYHQTNGFVVTHEVHKKYPDIKIIGFSTYDSENETNRIIELGAIKNLSKYTTTLKQLIEVIKSV